MNFLETISFSTWISLGALGISLLSFFNARKSLKQSKKSSEANRLLQAEKERTELLYTISDEKEQIESVISDLEGLQVIYKNEHQVVQTLLINYAKIFESHLPKLYELLKKVSSDYDAVISMDISLEPEHFLKLRAYQKDTGRDLKHIRKHTDGCILEFSQRIIQAREYQSHATSG